MSVYKLITQFLLLVSKNSILICWNVHLEDYFEGWIWLKDIILLYSLFILSLSIINIYIFLCTCSLQISFQNHKSFTALHWVFNILESRQNLWYLIEAKVVYVQVFKVVYDMNKIRFPPVLCGYEVDVS